MIKRRVGWHFPPTNGGRSDGFNDPGMAHFGGTPLLSLAREVIQNSLDARASSDPVEVSFEIHEVKDSKAYGRSQLADAVAACLKAASNNNKARTVFERAAEYLKKKKLTFLRVADYNTSGLHADHWLALVKKQGTSVKDKRGAGGSHGIGKYAPFALSPLRAVFYWSKFKHGRKSQEQFQGKAVLMSHDGPKGETQGTGFFGVTDGCEKLTGDDIPEAFRRVETQTARGYGTSLWIAGFPNTKGWQRRIARSVIENFFLAIHDKKLIVDVEPDRELEEHHLMQIDHETLPTWFNFLLQTDGTSDDSGEWVLEEARTFWEMVCDESAIVREKEDGDLGHCKLWIRVGENLPSKVALARQTGMVVTAQQKRLLRFPNMMDFAALCLFDSEKGNELLQGMENPQHNQFEPNWLPEAEQQRGRRALDRVVDWIRSEIREVAKRQVSEHSTVLTELARLLPDFEPDEAFGEGSKDGEGGFDGGPVIRPKQLRRRVVPLEEYDDAIGDEGDGDELGGHGGGGGGGQGDGDGRGGDGDGQGGTGTRGGSTGRSTLDIEDVRFIQLSGTDNKFRVSFTPRVSGTAALRFSEAGDSTAIDRHDIRVLDDEGTVISVEAVALTAGQRVTVEITSTEPIAGRAWRLTAVKGGGPPRHATNGRPNEV